MGIFDKFKSGFKKSASAFSFSFFLKKSKLYKGFIKSTI